MSIVFEEDFNNGNNVKQLGFKHSGNENVEFVNVGGERAIKLSLARYEDDVSYRTEIVPNNLPSSHFDNGTFAKMGQEYWYSTKMLLPSNWDFDTRQEVLMQFHGMPDSGEDWRNPPLALRIGNGDAGTGRNYLITQKADSRAQMNDKNYQFEDTTDIGSIVGDLGEWVTWTFHVKWSHRSDGFIEIYKNGEMVFEQRNQMNTYNDDRGPYLKLGIYKSHWNGDGDTGASERVIYLDDLKIGDSNASLADFVSGGSAPPSNGSSSSPSSPAENVAPEAENGTYNGVEENEPKEYSYRASDDNGDQLSFRLLSQPSEGRVVDNGDGTFTFDPDGDFEYLAEGQSKTVSFRFEARDGDGARDTATANVVVFGANDAPIASSGSVSGNGRLTGQLKATDVDSGSSLTFSLAAAGLVHISEFDTADPEARAPVQPEGGVEWDGFNYSGWGGGKIFVEMPNSSVAATIRGENGGPFSLHQLDATSLGGGDNGSIDVRLVGYRDGEVVGTARIDTGAPGIETYDFGDTFENVDRIELSKQGGNAEYLILEKAHTSLEEGESAENGSVVVNPDGTFAYTPDAGFSGGDSFTYRVTDEHGASDTSTVSVNVGGGSGNTGPVAGDVFENGVVEDGEPSTIAYDGSDEDGDSLNYRILTQPDGGEATDNGDGTFTFDPGADFQELGAGEHRDIQFTYEVSDGRGGTDIATATVRVFGRNDTPVAETDLVRGSGQMSGRLVASEADGQALTFALVATGADPDIHVSEFEQQDSGWGWGLGWNSDDSVDPEGGIEWNGFQYLSSGNGQIYTSAGGNGVVGTIRAEDGGTFSLFQLDALSTGSGDESLDVELVGYRDGDAVGTVSFSTLTNGRSATVELDNALSNVDRIEVVRTGGDGNRLVLENAHTTTDDVNLGAEHGSVEIAQDGTFSYTPDDGFTGTDSFTYSVTDASGAVATKTVSVEVSGSGGRTQISSNDGDMTVVGTSGDDHLMGAGGDDTLTGGSGNDVFFFEGDFGNDTITDFNKGGGTDRIDLSGLGITLSELSVTSAGTSAIIGVDGGNSIRLLGIQEGDLDLPNDLVI